MNRRAFLTSIGAGSVGAGALVGTGGYSRIRSQRRVIIEVGSGESAWTILVDNDEPDPTKNRLNELEGMRTNRWGWYMPYTIDGSADAEFWAGAGGNDLDAGIFVGNVEIKVVDDDLVVEIEMVDAALLESHLYVDTDTERLVDDNASPGQFDYDDGDPEFDEGIFTIPFEDIQDGLEQGNELILALHGVVEVED